MNHTASLYVWPLNVPDPTSFLDPQYHERPQHHFECNCQMCKQFDWKKQQKYEQQKTSLITKKIQSRIIKKPESNKPALNPYKIILKMLLPPSNKIVTRGLDIFVTETVFYKNGEPSLLMYNREWDEPVLKRSGKEMKINTALIQKLFNDRRRQYNNHINSLLGRKKKRVQEEQNTKIKNNFGKKKEIRKNFDAAVIVIYNDMSTQLLCETQFIKILQKRKLDPFWSSICCIKNLIRVQNELQRIFVLKYKAESIEHPDLFQRAKQLTRINGKNIQKGEKGYIYKKQEQGFCSQLRERSLKLYALYYLYKIVTFIEYFYDEKINLLVCKFLINEEGKIYFDNVYKFQMKTAFKYSWNNDVYIKKINQQQDKVFFSKDVSNITVSDSNIDKIEKTMDDIYQRTKNYYGLSNEEEDDEQQKINNSFYHFMHPEVKEDISQLLKGQKMSVNKFKKDFLGYKPTKKPLVRPYTSNMLRVLNETTQALHRAKPHDYLSVPKRSISTGFGTRPKKRSFVSTRIPSGVTTSRTGIL